MKANGELEAKDIAIDRDIDIEGTAIQFYVETWFDVDKKFGTHTRDTDDSWVDVYGTYDVRSCHLTMKVRVEESVVFLGRGHSVPWNPTNAEKCLILNALTAMCRTEYGETPDDLVREELRRESIFSAV